MEPHWRSARHGNFYRGDRLRLAAGQLFDSRGHHGKHCVLSVLSGRRRALECQLELFRNIRGEQSPFACLAKWEWHSRRRVGPPWYLSHTYELIELLDRCGFQEWRRGCAFDQGTTSKPNGDSRPDRNIFRYRNGHSSPDLSVEEK